jgi:tRNA dimethylallyltransferase
LVGPTASGKSALGVQLAQALGGTEIVTADSMQVYRGMDIGTAKPPPDQQGGVPHHLIDIADPHEDWDVTRFLAAAGEVLADIEARGRQALFVGGTGLYVHALVDGFAVPGRWPAVVAEMASSSDAELFGRLSSLDPAAAQRTGPGNRRRLLRALEVTVGSGRPFSSFGPGVDAFPPTAWRLAGVWLPRQVVGRRIEQRFQTMMDAGFLDEVRDLAQRPQGMSRTARQALGYRELLAHIEQGAPLDLAVAAAVSRTRQFARRQRMWWRRDPRVRWFGSAQNPLAVAAAVLGDWAT